MESIPEILRAVKLGNLSIEEAEGLLKLNALAAVGDFARLDYNRFLRRGVPEIVYAENKTKAQLRAIIAKLVNLRVEKGQGNIPIILSRVTDGQTSYIMELFSKTEDLRSNFRMKSFPEASLIAIASRDHGPERPEKGRTALLSAGTSDMAALNESEVVLNLLGCRTLRFNDVGVAGLHRLIEPLERIQGFDPDSIIVAAGMEGALPSVVAGLTSVPVIGLPTSVGYGYGKHGEAALMSMLQACSLGISVVNIDSGIAAGIVAWLISSRIVRDYKAKAISQTGQLTS
jgi:pyridinium-3,5-biscarboxylic acid mononucleotide synthase